MHNPTVHYWGIRDIVLRWCRDENIRNLLAAVVLLGMIMTGSFSYAGGLTPALSVTVQSLASDEGIPIIIRLTDKADISLFSDRDKKSRRFQIIRALKNRAYQTQLPIRAFLESRKAKKIRPLWITNALAVTVSPQVIHELVHFPGVDIIDLDYVIHAPPITVSPQAIPQWNLSRIKAPELWSLGFDGTGIVVANMDTGVDYLHPDLTSRWRGGSNSWFNPYANPANSLMCSSPDQCTTCELSSAAPCDVDGHGTATMGIMVGGTASGTNIGVAPGARWIAAKIFNDAGDAYVSVIHSGFQWLLDPDGNPSTDDAPDIVNNSWGIPVPNLCYQEFYHDIQTLRAAGIAVVFSAGNDGPNASSSVSPANNLGSFSAGATDSLDNMASFSSRGPSACDGSIFPEIVAPGVDVVTSYLSFGGDPYYAYVSGTSFAAPHVAGAMALLLDAFPTFTVSDVESVLTLSALDLGATGPDINFGYGLLDVKKAYDLIKVHSVPGATSSALTVAWNTTDNKLHIAARGMDSRIYLATLDQNGLFNNDWTPLPEGSTPSAPAIAWNPMDKRLHIIVRGMDDGIWGSTVDGSMGSFSGWTRLPIGITPSAPAVAWNPTDNRLHIVVRGMDDGIWGIAVDGSMGSFSGWTRHPVGGTPSAPAVAWNPTSGKLHIAVRGWDDRLYMTTISSNMDLFGGWTQLLVGMITSPPGVAWNPQKLEINIILRKADNTIEDWAY